METNYDFIIAGAGCAGLSLAYRMSIDPYFATKKILLIDKEQKNKQDRTWCFWHKDAHLFSEIVTKQWQEIEFYGLDFAKQEQPKPYSYYMIRSENFYAFCLGKINRAKNITALQGDIADMQSTADQSYIVVNNTKIYATKIFSSILLAEPVLQAKHIYLMQHFKGYVIETPTPVFNDNAATLMDFRISQQHGSAFVYTLPLSPTKALVEYTLFTHQLLADNLYDDQLKNYIHTYLKITDYTIAETEFGVIPMTNYAFTTQNNNIYFIGTAGAATKPSSGYTFTFIQRQADAIINQLKQEKAIDLTAIHPKRFLFYDEVLLHLLDTKQLGGAEIFSQLFKNNSMATIFQFLDNDTTIWQEIKLMNTVQRVKFIKSVFQRVFS